MLTLLGTLPEGTAFTAAIAGGPAFRGWTYDRYLLKTTIDVLQYQIYVLRRINGDKNAKTPPKPLWSPADVKNKREQGRSEFMSMARAQLALQRQEAVPPE